MTVFFFNGADYYRILWGIDRFFLSRATVEIDPKQWYIKGLLNVNGNGIVV